MPNILEQISGLCDSRYTSDPRTNQQLYSIKKIAGRNPILSVIDYNSYDEEMRIMSIGARSFDPVRVGLKHPCQQR